MGCPAFDGGRIRDVCVMCSVLSHKLWLACGTVRVGGRPGRGRCSCSCRPRGRAGAHPRRMGLVRPSVSTAEPADRFTPVGACGGAGPVVRRFLEGLPPDTRGGVPGAGASGSRSIGGDRFTVSGFTWTSPTNEPTSPVTGSSRAAHHCDLPHLVLCLRVGGLRRVFTHTGCERERSVSRARRRVRPTGRDMALCKELVQHTTPPVRGPAPCAVRRTQNRRALDGRPAAIAG